MLIAAVGLTADDMERGRYIRISQIQRLQKAGQLDASLRWMQQPIDRGDCLISDHSSRRIQNTMATMTLPSNVQEQDCNQSVPLLRHWLQRTFVDLGCLPCARRIRRLPTSTAARFTIRSTSMSASNCFLVQLEEYESAENIFSDYPYFSSYSDSWLKHC